MDGHSISHVLVKLVLCEPARSTPVCLSVFVLLSHTRCLYLKAKRISLMLSHRQEGNETQNAVVPRSHPTRAEQGSRHLLSEQKKTEPCKRPKPAVASTHSSALVIRDRQDRKGFELLRVGGEVYMVSFIV